MCCWRLQDSHLGGCTSRERIFVMWETTSLVVLPPLAAPPARPHPSNIRIILTSALLTLLAILTSALLTSSLEVLLEGVVTKMLLLVF